jgi:hypothetical protein
VGVNIGIVPDPIRSPDWPLIRAFLEPAAKRGGVPIIEAGEQVWTVIDGGELLAAATARPTVDGFGEVVLVGGRERHRWLGALSDLLCVWLAMEGMKSVRAYGRKGWKRELQALGWGIIGEDGKVVAYERQLA